MPITLWLIPAEDASYPVGSQGSFASYALTLGHLSYIATIGGIILTTNCACNIAYGIPQSLIPFIGATAD